MGKRLLLTSYLYEKLVDERRTHALYPAFLEDVLVPTFTGWGREPPPSTLIRIPGINGSEYSVYIGVTESGTPFYLDVFALTNPIVAVLGSSGSGKSELTKSIVYRFSEANPDTPILIVDFEGEYIPIAHELGGVVANLGTNAYLNLFDVPHPTLNPYKWAKDVVLDSLKKAMNLQPGQHTRQVPLLEKAIEDVLREAGISPDDPSTWNREMPTVYDVYRYVLSRRDKATGQERDSWESLRQKLETLTGPGKDFFSFPSTYKLRDLPKYRILVLGTKGMPETARDLVTYYVTQYFNRLMDHTEEIGGTKIRLLLVFDEAWIIFKSEGKNEKPVIEKLVRRMRKYGVMVIASTQRLAEVKDNIFSLASAAFIGSMNDAEEKSAIIRGRGLAKHYERVFNTLGRGRMLVVLDWADKKGIPHAASPLIVQVETAMGRYKRVRCPFGDEGETRKTEWVPVEGERLISFAEILRKRGR